MFSRSLVLLGAAVAAVGVLGSVACGDDDEPEAATRAAATAPASQGGDARITVSDNRFEPSTANVKVNHEATWEWKGSNPHQVVGTFDGEKVESIRLTGSGTFTFSFKKAGTFSYQCGVHGASMSGTIKVE